MGIIYLVLLALIIIVMAIPGFGAGYLLTKFFPYLSTTQHVLIVMATIGIPVFWLLRRRSAQPEQPEIKTEVRNGQLVMVQEERGIKIPRRFLFLFATLLGAVISHGINNVTLYIDNGTDRDISVSYRDNGYFVSPGSYLELEVKEGNNQLTVDGDKRVINLTDDYPNWIWNVRRQNAYSLNEVVYGDTDTSNGSTRSWLSEDSSELSRGLITDEIFGTKANYLFEAPASITVSKRFVGKNDVARHVLYRITRKEMEAARKADSLDQQALLKRPKTARSDR